MNALIIKRKAIMQKIVALPHQIKESQKSHLKKPNPPNKKKSSQSSQVNY